MNGSDVEVLRNDLAHIVGLITEVRKDIKNMRDKADKDREDLIRLQAWRVMQEADNRRVSQRLGTLQSDAKSDARKMGVMWGLISGGVLTAIATIVQGLFF